MYRKIADKYAAILVMVSFFLPMIVQVMALLLIGIHFVAWAFIDRYKGTAAIYARALGLSALFILYLAAFFFTPVRQFSPLLMLCQNRAALLALPFLCAAITPSSLAVIRGKLIYFVYGCLLCCLIANGMFIYQFCIGPGTMQHLGHVEYRLYIEQLTGIHPTYISMFLCFAIGILLVEPEGMSSSLRYLLLYVLCIFLLALFAKSAFIALLVMLVHYLYLRRHKLLRYKLQITGAMVALVGAGFLIPFFRQRAGEVFHFLGIGMRKEGSVADNSIYIRKLIWNTDIHLLRQHWLIGVGPAMLRHLLTIRYFFFSVAQGAFVGYYDPHNEYLSEWLSFGLLGIVALVGMLVIHLITAIRRRDYLYLYLLVILCILFSTETVLARQYGVTFYAVFTSLFFFYRKQQNDVV